VKIVDILLLEGMMFDTLFLFKIYRNKKRKMDWVLRDTWLCERRYPYWIRTV